MPHMPKPSYAFHLVLRNSAEKVLGSLLDCYWRGRMVSKWRREVAEGGSEKLIEGPSAAPHRGTIDAPIKPLPAEQLDERSLAESAYPETSDLPGQGLSDMPLDHTLSGRMERRLPIIVMVRLAQAERASTDEAERTYTDNISTHGARVFSKQPWQSGDEVTITPLNEQLTTCGQVVYCQRLGRPLRHRGDVPRSPRHMVRIAQI